MLTVPEAAIRARRHPETIRRWIREGRLRAHKVGTQHLIEVDDLSDVTGGLRHRAGEAPGRYESDAGSTRVRPALSANEWLPAIVGRIVRIADPVRIILYGARARPDARYDDDYELLVIMDDVPDRHAAMVQLRRSFEDVPVSAEILVASVAEVARGPFGPIQHALRDGRSVYAREADARGPMLLGLIATGRVSPAVHPDTSTLPPARPAASGMTATEALLAERREDPR